jgi:hypothetical protein
MPGWGCVPEAGGTGSCMGCVRACFLPRDNSCSPVPLCRNTTDRPGEGQVPILLYYSPTSAPLLWHILYQSCTSTDSSLGFSCIHICIFLAILCKKNCYRFNKYTWFYEANDSHLPPSPSALVGEQMLFFKIVYAQPNHWACVFFFCHNHLSRLAIPPPSPHHSYRKPPKIGLIQYKACQC